MSEWFKVPNAAKYSISRRTHQVRNDKTGRILKLAINNRGYIHACLIRDDGKAKTSYVHRIIAELFVKRPEGCNAVYHKNFVRTDNAEDNLEWTTHSRNIQHFWDETSADTAQAFRSRRSKSQLQFERKTQALKMRFLQMAPDRQLLVLETLCKM